MEIKLSQTIYHLEIILLIRTQQYKKAILLAPEIELWLEKYGKKIPSLNRLILKQSLALCFFHSKEYEKALRWIRIIINESRQDVKQDINLYSRLLELVIHFELKEYDLVENMANSIIRFTNNKDVSYEPIVMFSNKLAKNIRKAVNASPQKVRKIFLHLKNQFLKMKVFINGKEDIIIWLERQLH